MERQIRTASGLIVLSGLWLIVSPFVLSFAGSVGMWDAIVVGVVGVILGGIQYANPEGNPVLSWLVVLLGLWLYFSMYLFGWTDIMRVFQDFTIVGAGFVIFGLWSALAHRTQRPTM